MKTRNLDRGKPAKVPEIVEQTIMQIAQTVTQNPHTLEYLCARARRHWRTLPSSRQSFEGKDEQEVLTMWLTDGSKYPPCDSPAKP